MAPYARFCRDCTHKPANRGTKTKKYAWTPERDEIMRRLYDSTVRGRAAEIAKQLGWPAWVIKKRARVLGLGKGWPEDRKSRITWPDDQVAFLLDHVGTRTALWIAKRLGRSETSVVLKIKRLKLSRRVDDGTYNARQIAEGFGVDHSVVRRWIRAGWLSTDSRMVHEPTETWRITPEAVRTFISSHPLAFDIHKVDQVWFLEVLRIIRGEVAA